MSAPPEKPTTPSPLNRHSREVARGLLRAGWRRCGFVPPRKYHKRKKKSPLWVWTRPRHRFCRGDDVVALGPVTTWATSTVGGDRRKRRALTKRLAEFYRVRCPAPAPKVTRMSDPTGAPEPVAPGDPERRLARLVEIADEAFPKQPHGVRFARRDGAWRVTVETDRSAVGNYDGPTLWVQADEPTLAAACAALTAKIRESVKNALSDEEKEVRKQLKELNAARERADATFGRLTPLLAEAGRLGGPPVGADTGVAELLRDLLANCDENDPKDPLAKVARLARERLVELDGPAA